LSFLCKWLLICAFWQFCIKLWISSFDMHFDFHCFFVSYKCFVSAAPSVLIFHQSPPAPTSVMHRSQNTWIPWVCSGMRYIMSPQTTKKPISVTFVLRGHFRRQVELSNYLLKINNKCIVAKLFVSFFLASLIPSTFIFVTFLLKSLSFSVRFVPSIGFLSMED
jgi:hypothetical protein